MKLIINKIAKALLASLLLVTLFTACKDEMPYGEFTGLFRPIAFTAELNKTVATISWAPVDGAQNYTLQLSQDSLFSSNIVDTTLVGKSYVIELPGETKFFARIRANALDTLKNSNFNQTLSFKTPKENLFLGYTSVMSDYQTMKLSWTPNANLTKIVLKDAAGSITEYLIDHAELVAGQKIIVGLPNSSYTIQLYNNVVLRGTNSVVIEGDVFLADGSNLGTAIAAATAGQVILLEKGGSFQTSAAATLLNKSIKIKGASPTERAIISMVAGSGTSTTSAMFGFADQSVISSVNFENVDLTGYCGNVPTATKVGYIFNNNTFATVGKLVFNNCIMRNLGNTPMRLQGNKNQKIDTLIMNKCKVFDIGFGSTYAIVNSNSADLINNIFMTNSTFYNFKGSLILRTGQSIGSVNITNCTVNQGMQDTGSARYLLDFNTATFNGSGITIKNCIFGQTGATVGANGYRGTVTPTITGSYYTSDYVDDPIPVGLVPTSLKAKMTAYTKSSTALWTDPTSSVAAPLSGGNFTLKDATFAGKGVAGDLSWY